MVGGQLKGDSTAEGYVRALQQGCRCVEREWQLFKALREASIRFLLAVDVWDGPEDPVIYHGRTLTSKVSAREALTAIARYAFVASSYPVILSLEMHCGAVQHDKLAKIMRETLGSALLDGMIDEDTDSNSLPSPAQLQYKILIKAKHPAHKFSEKKGKGDSTAEDSTGESSSAGSDSDLKWSTIQNAFRRLRTHSSSGSEGGSLKTIPNPPSRITSDGPRLSTPTSSFTDSYPQISGREASPPRLQQRLSTGSNTSQRAASPARTKMPVDFAALLVYTTGVKWRGFNKKEYYEPTHIVSLGERTANKAIKEAKTDLIAHTRTHLTRVYPSGARFTSSNYLPHHLWGFGVQLVAINWQTFGAPHCQIDPFAADLAHRSWSRDERRFFQSERADRLRSETRSAADQR